MQSNYFRDKFLTETNCDLEIGDSANSTTNKLFKSFYFIN